MKRPLHEIYAEYEEIARREHRDEIRVAVAVYLVIALIVAGLFYFYDSRPMSLGEKLDHNRNAQHRECLDRYDSSTCNAIY